MTFAGNLVFLFFYFIIARESLKLATLTVSVSPVWPPTGFAISVLLIFGRRFLPAIFLGAWLVNFLTPVNPLIAFMVGIGNMLEALCGAYIFESIRKYQKQLEHLTTPLAIVMAGLVAPLIAATIGVGSLFVLGDLPDHMFVEAWLTWWVGDIVGALFVVPLLVAVYDGDFVELYNLAKSDAKKYTFFTMVSVGVLGATAWAMSATYSLKYLFLMIPVLLVFTLSKNRFFVYFFGSLIPLIAIYFTIGGKGPFNLSSLI
jgi:integral membrane sensor domain MASE1